MLANEALAYVSVAWEKVSGSRQKDSQRRSTALQTDEVNFHFWKVCLSKWSMATSLENKMETKGIYFMYHPRTPIFTNDKSSKTTYFFNPQIRTKAPQREMRLKLLRG